MTASAGAWYRVGKVNVVGGSQSIVGVDTNWQSDVIAIAIGDVFTLDAKTWYEVTAVNSDTSITLDRGFEGSTGTDKSYAILRNTSGTILTRIAGQVSVQFNQKQLFLDELRTWLNSNNATEELTDSHGLKQSLKTPSQMVRDHDNKLAELDAIHPYPWAMRKVEFEARRAANNEKFAASGFVHFGKHGESSGNIVPVNQGMWVHEAGVEASKALHFGRRENYVGGISKTEEPIINIAGVLSVININHYSGDIFNDKSATSIKFPPAEDGTRTYDSATGISVTHATPAIAFASETDTNKVVTDRVDAWGFEAFLREINDTDPFVYDKGLIQSQATNINGAATVTDNVRPDTYFAWYEGDDSSTGKGVNWQTATEAQRTAIASNPDNNIYFDDTTGKFYQWCVRGRSFAGIGNGDWDAVDASRTANLTLRQQPVGTSQRTPPQGILNTSPTSGDGSNYYSNTDSEYNLDPIIGLFTSRRNDVSSEGFSYFLVCGTVSRLNKGVYHPSFNPNGTAWTYDTTIQGKAQRRKWFEIGDNAFKITNKEQAFSEICQNIIGQGGIDSGDISQHRPDQRLYDVIYASGPGGVCRDMRYSAWGLTQEDFAEADLKVKSGEYRGHELLQTSKVFSVDTSKDTADSGVVTDYTFKRDFWKDKGLSINTGENYYVLNKDTNELFYTNNDQIYRTGGAEDNVYWPTAWGVSPNILVVRSINKNTDIAGEYSHTEVIGDPANILLCDDLKDGWVGSWNPEIPDGTNKEYRLTKKQEGSVISVIYSDDLGETWRLSSTVVTDTAKNSLEIALPADALRLWVYTAKAKMTENSVNSEVYGGEKGIGSVFASESYRELDGGLLNYSLTGNISTHAPNTFKVGVENKAILSSSLAPSFAKLWSSPSAGETIHTPIALTVPSNNGPAFKALNYNVVENQQGFISYAYTELKYDDAASDWGDDGKIHIADNQATRLDDNGNSVVYGTARIVEPLGWIKNDK